MRIENEDQPVPAGHAALKVALAGLVALIAGAALLGLGPAMQIQIRSPRPASPSQAPPLPPPMGAEEGLPLPSEDVDFLRQLTSRLNTDRAAGPEDVEIDRVQALYLPRPENARLRSLLVELLYRRAEADVAQHASDDLASMLDRIRSLEGESPRLTALEMRARTQPLGVASDRAPEPSGAGIVQFATPAAQERARATPAADPDKAQIQSSTFDVRFDGDSQNGVARDVLFVLDRAYARLSDVYYDKPNRRIPVTLHTQMAYYTKTGAPFWSGGFYSSHDGGIQIPIKGMPSTLPREMENVLQHELSHAFVDAMSGGLAGRDLQEGLAQYMEGKRIEEELSPAELKRLANSGRQSVMSFYMLSLVVAQQLIQSRGQTAVNELLKAMRESGSEDGGFRKTFGRSRADMQRDVFETFWRRYS